MGRGYKNQENNLLRADESGVKDKQAIYPLSNKEDPKNKTRLSKRAFFRKEKIQFKAENQFYRIYCKISN